MQKHLKLIIAIVIVVGVALVASFGTALVPVDDAGTRGEVMDVRAETVADGDWARQDAEVSMDVEFTTIEKVLANLNQNQRQGYLDNADAFKQLVQQEAGNMSVLAAARANGVQDNENTKFLIRRSTDNIILETYLARLINGKLPEGFPSEEQVREYFDKNKESFFLGERVHVWQIFLLINENNSAEAIATQMNKIRGDIQNNGLDFADAALQYSQHGPSKASGGYMGLVKVSDLKPGLADTILKLPEGRLSEPITTDAGIHLLKRGAIVPKQDVTFAQVQGQIRNLLIQQAQGQLRQAVYNQAAKTYPVEIPEENLEEWRSRLTR